MFRKFIAYTPQQIGLWEDWLLTIYSKLNKQQDSLSPDIKRKQSVQQKKDLIIRHVQHEDDKTVHDLEKKITQGKNFINALTYQPHQLALELAEHIAAILHEYLLDYYVENKLYQALYGYDDKINAILLAYHDEETINAQNVWRERYALLCGFVWDLNRFKNIINFCETLKLLMQKIHLSDVQEVANSLNRLSCKNKFIYFKSMRGGLFNPSPEELLAHRFCDFNMALSSLKKTTQRGNSELHRLGANLVEAINSAIIDQQPKKLSHQLPFYTPLLKASNRTLSDPLRYGGELRGFLPQNYEKSINSHSNMSATFSIAGIILMTVSMLGTAGILRSGMPLAFFGIVLGGACFAMSYVMRPSSGFYTWQKSVALFRHQHEEIHAVIYDFSEEEKIVRSRNDTNL